MPWVFVVNEKSYVMHPQYIPYRNHVCMHGMIMDVRGHV